MENAMKLFEFPPTRSIRARWTLQELGVDFEAVRVNLLAAENRSPAFLKLNPAGKVPVLVDGDLVLTESVAIALYLADKYPDKGFAPTDVEQRAELNRWLLFTTTELEQPLWRILDEHMNGRQFVVGDTVTVADFVLAHTLDWANEAQLLGGFPRLHEYMERMYERPHAAPRIAAAFASINTSLESLRRNP
jgi:glutathione S-transferase